MAGIYNPSGNRAREKGFKSGGCYQWHCQRIALTGWALRGVAHWFQQECILQVDQTKSSLHPPRYHPCTDSTLPCIHVQTRYHPCTDSTLPSIHVQTRCHLQQLYSATLPKIMYRHSNFICFRFAWSSSLVVCQLATYPATRITA